MGVDSSGSAEGRESVFRCDSCKTVVPAGTREQKVIVETRSKTYEARGGSGRDGMRSGPRSRGPIGRRARRQRAFDKGGSGTEIVREIALCPKCFAEHAAEVAAAAAAAAAAELTMETAEV